MLLANLVKSDSLVKHILTLSRDAAPKVGLVSNGAMNQLMDCFVRGAEGGWNKRADFDYLAWVFADVAKVGEMTSLSQTYTNVGVGNWVG